MSELTKLSVNLVPRSVAALETAAEQTGDTRTDTVNRALQLYAAVMNSVTAGGGVLEFFAAEGRPPVTLSVTP